MLRAEPDMFRFVYAFQCLIECGFDALGHVAALLPHSDCRFVAFGVCFVDCDSMHVGGVFFCHR